MDGMNKMIIDEFKTKVLVQHNLSLGGWKDPYCSPSIKKPQTSLFCLEKFKKPENRDVYEKLDQ